MPSSSRNGLYRYSFDDVFTDSLCVSTWISSLNKLSWTILKSKCSFFLPIWHGPLLGISKWEAYTAILLTPFVCAVCHSKSRVLWMEIRRSLMGTFLTSYAHAFSTVIWRHFVLHVRKKQNAKKSSLSWVIAVSKICNSIDKFAIPL